MGLVASANLIKIVNYRNDDRNNGGTKRKNVQGCHLVQSVVDHQHDNPLRYVLYENLNNRDVAKLDCDVVRPKHLKDICPFHKQPSRQNRCDVGFGE